MAADARIQVGLGLVQVYRYLERVLGRLSISTAFSLGLEDSQNTSAPLEASLDYNRPAPD